MSVEEVQERPRFYYPSSRQDMVGKVSLACVIPYELSLHRHQNLPGQTLRASVSIKFSIVIFVFSVVFIRELNIRVIYNYPSRDYEDCLDVKILDFKHIFTSR